MPSPRSIRQCGGGAGRRSPSTRDAGRRSRAVLPLPKRKRPLPAPAPDGVAAARAGCRRLPMSGSRAAATRRRKTPMCASPRCRSPRMPRAASSRWTLPRTRRSSRATCCSGSIPSRTVSRWPRRTRRSPPRGSSVEQLRAAYSQAVAQERMAADEVDYLKTQLDRQSELASKGINTRSSLDEARHDLAKAQDEQQLAALQGIASARAAIGGDPDIETDTHPAVMAAQAARDKAAWILAQTTVTAPADGIISQSTAFKVGQYVTVGHAAVQPGRERRHLGRGQFQGDPAHQHDGRAAGRDRPRHLSRPSVQGGRRQHRRRHRLRILAAAGAERHRQLGEGDAAHSGPPQGRRRRSGDRRCAPA